MKAYRRNEVAAGLGDGLRPKNVALNQHWFLSLHEASAKLEVWRVNHNAKWLHSALGLQTPDQFVKEKQLKAVKRQEN